MNRITTKLAVQGTLIGILAACAVGCGDDPVGINAAPVVSIDAPFTETTVTGAVDLKATVTDDRGVSKVNFIVDGEVIATDSDAPYEAVWMSPGDGAIHSINVEAFDNDGAATNTVVRVRTEQGVTVVIDNLLLFPVNIEVNGVLIGSVPAQSVAQKNVGKVDTVQVRWTLVRQTTSEGNPVGDHMGGVFPTITAPDGTESVQIDNLIDLLTYMVPVVTNTTTARFLMGVNMERPEENRCNCVVGENSSSVPLGYYVLPSGGNVRGYREENGYTGPFLFWNEGEQFFMNDLQPGTGRINLLADFIPGTRPEDPSGSVLPPAARPPARVPVEYGTDTWWETPVQRLAPSLPLR